MDMLLKIRLGYDTTPSEVWVHQKIHIRFVLFGFLPLTGVASLLSSSATDFELNREDMCSPFIG